jgi:hypothetical protein
MRIEDWPASRTAEFIAAYRLDETDLGLVTPVAGSAAGDRAGTVARIWDAARRVPGAVTMLLKTDDRSWVAAGSVLVEGRPKLNLGLLMSSLRTVPALAAAPPSVPKAPRDAQHKVIWAIASRLAQVEVDRTFLLDTGKIERLYVTRDGFALPEGVTPADLRKAIAAAIKARRPVRYSLGPKDDAPRGPTHAVTSIFGAERNPEAIVLSSDAWPLQLPETAGFSALSSGMTLVQQMSAAGCGPGSRLQVMGVSSTTLVTAVLEDHGWTVKAVSPGA